MQLFLKQQRANLNLIQVIETTESGSWNNFSFVAGKKEEFHVETDCAYTFITVPNQILQHRSTSFQKNILLVQN